MATLLSIGTDAEIFAQDVNGKAISLCGKIGGSKTNPKPMGVGHGFAVQEDNVSVEFNIPPATNIIAWDEYIRVALNEVQKMLAVMKLTFSHNVSISFDKDQLLHPNALIFGCEPDFNAWTKCENDKPQCNDPTLRTAGGHIHVGSRGNMINCVEKMDLYLGVPSVILDDTPASIARRQLYGKAGAMRPKSYGWEYRVLSNFWIFSKELRTWVFKNTVRAIEHEETTLTSRDSTLIQKCINEGDKELAQFLIKKFHIGIPSSSGSVKVPLVSSTEIEEMLMHPNFSASSFINDGVFSYAGHTDAHSS